MDQAKEWPESVKHVYVPIYGQNVYLIDNQEDLKKCLEYLGTEEVITACAGLSMTYEHADGETLQLLCVFDNNPFTLVHEVGHVTFNILRDVGVDLSGSNEAYCYLLGYLYSEAFQLMFDKDKIGGECRELV